MPGIDVAIITAVGSFLFANTAIGMTAALTIGQVVTYALGAAAFYGVSQLAMQSMMPSASDLAAQMDTGISSVPQKRFVYGECRVGGDVVFMATSRHYTGTHGNYVPGGGEQQELHMIIEVAGHPIESFSSPTTDCEVWVGDEQLTFTAVDRKSGIDLWPNPSSTDNNGVTRYYVTNSNYYTEHVGYSHIMLKFYDGTQTQADQDLIDAMTYSDDSWDSTKIGQGRAYVYARCEYQPKIFQGMPKFTFKIKGKNDVKDPRTSSSGWTDNPALIMADYMTTGRESGGLGEDWDQLDMATLVASANECEESVTVHEDSTTQDRYVLNGTFNTAEAPSAIMTEILASMAGWTERINGKWFINAGAYTAPDMTLTESEMRDRASVSLNHGFKDVFNSVRPTLRSEENEWLPGNAKTVEALERIDVTADYTNNEFDATAHGLSDGDRVRIHSWTSGTINDANLPSGLSDIRNTWVYVVNASADSFQVSKTSGGSAETFTTAGTGQIFVYHDPYLTADQERKTIDVVYSLVTDETQARRLALISLLQTRMEITAQLKCKIGTTYACPFDLKVGDAVRWIDAHKDFWELTGSEVTGASCSASGVITSTSHGLSDGDPVVVTDNGTSNFREEHPLYVVDSTANTFGLANYRGGPTVATTTGTGIGYQTIQGKLFRVAGWKLDLSNGIPGVDLDLVETASNIYTWQSGYEEAPETRSSITVKNPMDIATPSSMSVTSGTNVLYRRQDGTIGSRAKISWTDPNDAYITNGDVEVQYRQNVDKTFTVNFTTDTITSAGHGFSANDRVILTSSGTLPTGLTAGTEYFIYNTTTDTFQLVDYKGSTTVIDISDVGSGTHTVRSYNDSDWTKWPSVSGSATSVYLHDLEDGVDHDFRIRFRNSFGCVGAWAYTWDHTVVGKTAAPGAPTGFSASTSQSNGVLLTWTDPSDLDLQKIEIYRDDGAGGSSVYLTMVQVGVQRYLDLTARGNTFAGSGGSSSKSYEYKIRAVDTSGNVSDFTSEETGSISAPSGPASVSGSGGSLNATVTWSNSGEFASVLVGLYNDSPNPGTLQSWKTVPASDETLTLSASAGSGYYFVLRYVIHGRTAGTEYSQSSTSSTFTVSSPT